jgi:hypothetical protein
MSSYSMRLLADKLTQDGIASDLCFESLILFIYTRYYQSLDSVVGIATGYALDGREVGVRVPVGSPRRPDRLWGQPNLLSNGYRGDPSPGVKQPGCKDDHSPPASAEVKKMCVYTSTPPYAFMAKYLIR